LKPEQGKKRLSTRTRIEFGLQTLFERRAAVKKTYQGTKDKSKGKFEVLWKRELLVEVRLPKVEVWQELQPQVEQWTGQAGLRIISTILENEVTRRVGPPHRPEPTSRSVLWGHLPGYVVSGGRKVAGERPRVRTREGQEVELDSYARLQHDGRRQRALREGIVAGLTSRIIARPCNGWWRATG
jgi:hypothetical protein